MFDKNRGRDGVGKALKVVCNLNRAGIIDTICGHSERFGGLLSLVLTFDLFCVHNTSRVALHFKTQNPSNAMKPNNNRSIPSNHSPDPISAPHVDDRKASLVLLEPARGHGAEVA